MVSFIYIIKEAIHMSVERVKDYLGKYHMDGRVMELQLSSATVELAARAL